MSYLNREVKQNPSQLAFKSQPHDVKIILFYLQKLKSPEELLLSSQHHMQAESTSEASQG